MSKRGSTEYGGRRLTLHQSGRRVPQPRHSISSLTQAWQAPVSSGCSSHRFLRILQVQQPALDRGGMEEEPLRAVESARRRVRLRGMAGYLGVDSWWLIARVGLGGI